MEEIKFKISEKLYKRLGNYTGSNGIGKYSILVAKEYFLAKKYSSDFEEPRKGADLVACNEDGIKERYEVKGSTMIKFQWKQFFVSGKQSFTELNSNVCVLLRIININNITVSIYFLKANHDFKMAQEPRWIIKKLKRKIN